MNTHPRNGRIGRIRQCDLEFVEGFLRIPLLCVQQAQKVMRVGQVGIVEEGAHVGLFRRIELLVSPGGPDAAQ